MALRGLASCLGRRRLPAISTALVVLLTVALASLAAGCTPPGEAGGPRFWFYPSPSPTDRPAPTLTPTEQPTPTDTPTPTATPSPTPTPVPFVVSVSVDRAAIVQGHTAVVRARTNAPALLRGTIQDREFSFVSSDGMEHVALVGVSAVAAIAPQALAVTARSENGQEVTLLTPLPVVAGDYRSETIRLSAQVAKLLDPEITRPELLRVAEVFGRFTPRILWDGPFDWPIRGPVTSRFGTRRQYGDQPGSFHTGMDIDGETGDAIRAPAKGSVVLAEELQVRGGAVIVDHGAGVVSGYYHLSRIDVAVGLDVERGSILGAMGSTGLATGSHLHWELRVGGIAVEPTEWTERPFP